MSKSHTIPSLAAKSPRAVLIYSRKYPEAIAVLRQLGFPRAQQTGRAALTLLALLGLTPDLPWRAATAPPCRISTLLAFAARHYAAAMPPHAREAVRRRCVRPFLAAGLVVANPDRPDRPVNSPTTTYQIAPDALALLRTFGAPSWDGRLITYQTTAVPRATRSARHRYQARLPVTLPTGRHLMLSPGGQNVLVKRIIEECCPRFLPAGQVLYVGDAGARFASVDWDGLHAVGVGLDVHDRLPDLIVHDRRAHRLVLIEALRRLGLSRAKAATLRDVALRILSGELSEERLEALPSAVAMAILTALPGIGPWSAGLILLRGLRRTDVFPAGDVGAVKNLGRLLGAEAPARESDQQTLLARMGDTRGYLYFYALGWRLLHEGLITPAPDNAA